MLKWRTLQDAALCQSVREAFAQQRGITSERIELRGASFHPDVLKQYADIDIALDPFPFTAASPVARRCGWVCRSSPGRLAQRYARPDAGVTASPLMDVAGFTGQSENTLHRLYAEIAEKETLRSQ